MMRRLLVVDDEKSILFAVSEYFSEQGFEVQTASGLTEARGALEARRFDAAVVDLRLSPSEPLGGLMLARELRERWPATRVILLTAYGSRQVEESVRSLGIDALLSKPQPLAEISQLLNGLLGRHTSRVASSQEGRP